MKNTARLITVMAVITGGAALAGMVTGNRLRPPPLPPLRPVAVTVPAAAPLSNDASAGKVVLTFDDGPDNYTPALLREMRALHLHGVFFVFGDKVHAYPQIAREEAAAGDLVENHTYDHVSFTGASTGTPPLTAGKIRAELAAAQQDILAAGLPAPALYRPPFGDITRAGNQIAGTLGLRIVEPFSVTGTLITDSRDWAGASPQQIARNVTTGYELKGRHVAGISGGARILAFHDAAPGACQDEPVLCGYAANVIKSLPLIVAWLDAHHYGVTTDVPQNATGGVIP